MDLDKNIEIEINKKTEFLDNIKSLNDVIKQLRSETKIRRVQAYTRDIFKEQSISKLLHITW